MVFLDLDWGYMGQLIFKNSEFLTTQEGDVSVELGARLGPSPRCPLQFRPARARWGAPVSAKFQNAPHCLRVEFGKRRGFWRDPCAFGGLARTFCGR